MVGVPAASRRRTDEDGPLVSANLARAMSRREELLALAERCEGAPEGRSAELDEAISCAIFPELRQVSVTASVTGPEMIWEMRGQRVRILDYSSSLDAALSLVPEGAVWHVMTDYGDLQRAKVGPANNPSASIYSNEDRPLFIVADAATPALALTAAALRARAAKEDGR